MSERQSRRARQKLMNKLKEIHSKTMIHDKVETTLYHFTSGCSLNSILKTKQLWMTSYQVLKLKDPSEIGLLSTHIFETLREKLPGNQKLEEFITLFKKYHEPFDIFTTSLCENLHNKHLWDKYAEQSKGVAIGFSENYFTPREEGEDGFNRIYLRVAYGHEEISRSFDQGINAFCDFIVHNHSKKHMISCFSKFTSIIFTEMPRYKENKYHEEQEHRLYMKDRSENDKIPPLFIHDGHGIIEDILPDYLTEIVIGTNSSIEPLELNKQLESLGYKGVRVLRYIELGDGSKTGNFG